MGAVFPVSVYVDVVFSVFIYICGWREKERETKRLRDRETETERKKERARETCAVCKANMSNGTDQVSGDV